MLFFLYIGPILKISVASFKFISFHKLYSIRDSTACAVPRTRTGRSKVIRRMPGSVLFFRYSVLAQGPNKPTIPWAREGLFPVIKGPEIEACHLFISNKVVRNIV
jgi:hypothetical protein